jgi:hypothetical protein
MADKLCRIGVFACVLHGPVCLCKQLISGCRADPGQSTAKVQDLWLNQIRFFQITLVKWYSYFLGFNYLNNESFPEVAFKQN